MSRAQRYRGDIADVVDLCGAEVATEMVERLGGLDIRVPAELSADHPLMRLTEPTRARFLKHFGASERLYIPRQLGSKADLARSMKRQGRSVEEIALTLQVTMRTVYNWLGGAGSKRPADTRQSDLFG